MKKCRLCGRPVSSGTIVCSECRSKIGNFAKKSIAGTAVVAGAAAAAVAARKKGAEGIEEISEKIREINVSEGAEKVRNAGMKVIEEGRETVNLAGSFIEEHTMGVKDLVERGIDAAELKLKGLPAAYAREEHPFLIKKIRDRYNKWMDDIEESSSQFMQERLMEEQADEDVVVVDEEELMRMIEED